MCLGQVTAKFFCDCLPQCSTKASAEWVQSAALEPLPQNAGQSHSLLRATLLLCVLRAAAPQPAAWGSLTRSAKHQLALVCRYELKATGRWSGPPEKVPDLYAANLALEEQLQDVRKELLDAKTVAGKVCGARCSL